MGLGRVWVFWDLEGGLVPEKIDPMVEVHAVGG
jgi:hypothetical protein